MNRLVATGGFVTAKAPRRNKSNKNNYWVEVVAVALGYFADLYDILLFSAVKSRALYRLPSFQKGTYRNGKRHPVVAMELHRLIVEKTAKRVGHVFK